MFSNCNFTSIDAKFYINWKHYEKILPSFGEHQKHVSVNMYLKLYIPILSDHIIDFADVNIIYNTIQS